MVKVNEGNILLYTVFYFYSEVNSVIRKEVKVYETSTRDKPKILNLTARKWYYKMLSHFKTAFSILFSGRIIL